MSPEALARFVTNTTSVKRLSQTHKNSQPTVPKFVKQSELYQ